MERAINHISDDTGRIALLEVKTRIGGSEILPANQTKITRYQYNNHLGSACLELNENAEVLSYEEYHPFGTSSYRSGDNAAEVSLKLYRYNGKERDEETGLYNYGMRCYCAWLCRFVSVDPLKDDYPHYTSYQYAGNKPITYIDLDGLEEADPESKIEPTIRDLVKINENIVKPDKPGEKTVNELKEEKKTLKNNGDFDRKRFREDVAKSKEVWRKYNNELEKYTFFENLITELETADNKSPLGNLRDVILENNIPILLSAGTNLIGKTGNPALAQTQLSITTTKTEEIVTEKRVSLAEITFDYNAILNGAQTEVTTQLNKDFGLMDINLITATPLSTLAHELGHFKFDIDLLGGPSFDVGIDPSKLLESKEAKESSEDYSQKIEREYIIFNRRK